MAEVYTISINNETPTEITGGRVGNFKVIWDAPSIFLGGEDLAVTYEPNPLRPDFSDTPTVSNGFPLSTNYFPTLQVTSPDGVYALVSGQHYTDSPTEYVLTIFHNR